MKLIVTVAGAMIIAPLLSACVGPLVPVTRVEQTTAVELTEAIQVFDARETPATATILGPLTANSCKNKLWEKDASNDDAIAQLRLMSRQRGGNAVGNLVCEKPQGTSMATNCWASITCTGTAIRIGDKPAPTLPKKRR